MLENKNVEELLFLLLAYEYSKVPSHQKCRLDSVIVRPRMYIFINLI